MDPSDLIPGLGKMLKEHLRPSDEPRDLAYWMVVSMSIAVWAFLLLLPVGAVVIIATRLVSVLHGPVETRTFLIFIDWVVVIGAIPSSWFIYQWLGRVVVMRALKRHGAELEDQIERFAEHVEEHERDEAMHFVVSGEDAEKQWPKIKRRLDAYTESIRHEHRIKERVDHEAMLNPDEPSDE